MRKEDSYNAAHLANPLLSACTPECRHYWTKLTVCTQDPHLLSPPPPYLPLRPPTLPFAPPLPPASALSLTDDQAHCAIERPKLEDLGDPNEATAAVHRRLS